MTHDHSALIAQLNALKGTDPASVFAELIRAGLQSLIDAEATQVLGVGRYERTANAQTTATSPARRLCRRPAETSRSRSRSCAQGLSSRACSRVADASIRRCTR